MKLTMELGARSHDIIIKRGSLGRAGMLANLTGRVLLVTDDGVPAAYVNQVRQQCGRPEVLVLRRGEQNKTPAAWLLVLERLQALGFGQSDMVAAVGGGMVGDIAGFAAACFAYGMPWCHFPTTTLAQVDAAIGGRTGFELADSFGNIGAYHQPIIVIIDPDTLATLPPRHHASGLAEALKTGLVGSGELFEALENGPPAAAIERVVYLSVRCKKSYVEQDETGRGVRRLLDFGYTLGLGIKAQLGGTLLHGECIALGMLPMLESRTLRRRVKAAMKKLGLPLCAAVDNEKLLAHVQKTATGGACRVVRVKKPGQGYLDTVSLEELRLLLDEP